MTSTRMEAPLPGRTRAMFAVIVQAPVLPGLGQIQAFAFVCGVHGYFTRLDSCSDLLCQNEFSYLL